MSQTPAAPAPPSRPTLVDYFLLVLGFALSVYLSHVGPLTVAANDSVTDPRLRTAISYLPDLMRLPEGVILLWPLFLGLQLVLGRKQGLTFIEWLWVFSWLGVAVLTGLAAWKNNIGLSEPILTWAGYAPRLWYVILATTMAALAVLLTLLGVFSRQPKPWTHSFGAVLLVWPALMAAAILAVGRFTP